MGCGGRRGDAEALRALTGDAEVEDAHRTLLARGGTDPFAKARHALGARDARAVVASVPAGVDRVRERGDLASAMTLLSEARAQLGWSPAAPLAITRRRSGDWVDAANVSAARTATPSIADAR